jgi:translocation and assembly module TamA
MRSRQGWLATATAVCLATTAIAADPQSYQVSLAPTGSEAMDNTLMATSDLESLRKNAPVSPFGLIARARSDEERLKTVLESYGYYQSRVMTKIDGIALDDPDLGERLSAIPKGTDAQVAIAFDLGPLYHLRGVTIDGEVPPAARAAFKLAPGDPAVATAVLNAGARLLSALREEGYAFAKVDEPVAYEDAKDPVLDVSFHVEAGSAVNIGAISFTGMKRLHESVLRKRLLLHTGEPYSSSSVERARKDLLSLVVLAAVEVHLGTAADSSGGVPVTFVVRERSRHAVGFNTAYSSDLGGSLGATWTDRDVAGGAQQLAIAGTVLGLGGKATTALGYNTSVKYTLPEFWARDQSLQFAVGAIRQSLIAYDQKAVTAGVSLTRKLSSIWTASIGVATAHEQVLQYELDQPDQVNRDYTLIMLPLTVTYDTTDLASPLDDPTHGMRDSVSFTPTESISNPSATFLISQLKLAAYFDVAKPFGGADGRSVLAMRALVGLAQGAGEYSLPPDQRFYGGGSGTIRGYEYQSVGPLFTTPRTAADPGEQVPLGGTAIIAGSIEFRQRIAGNFGAAAFVDGGQVSASLKPLPDIFRIGFGVGLRYYTPIGPVRLDFAFPTRAKDLPPTQQYDEPSFQVYVGLGQAF